MASAPTPLRSVRSCYLVGFTGNLLVPRSIDVGPGGPWPHACWWTCAVERFRLATQRHGAAGFQGWWTRFVPPLVERSTYLFATCLVLAMIFLFWLPIPAPVVWVIDSATGVALCGPVRDRVGARTAQHVSHRPPGTLRTSPGVCAPRRSCARPGHVQDTGALSTRASSALRRLAARFWAAPVMTAGRLLFALGGSTYILVGIFFEERDLLAQFGDRYRKYRNEVGMLIPRRSSRNGGA